jgi:hypothetical protein
MVEMDLQLAGKDHQSVLTIRVRRSMCVRQASNVGL